MIQEISYSGHTAQPADHACQDGELSVSMGVIAEDGALRPVLRPKLERRFVNHSHLLYIHETTSFRHFITQSNTKGAKLLMYGGDDVETGTLHNFTGERIHQITHVGNTLMVLADKGIHYFLWKENNYKYLGTDMPELTLSFGLRGEMVRSSQIYTEFSKCYRNDKNRVAVDDDGEVMSGENEEVIYDEEEEMYYSFKKQSLSDARTRVLGKANKLIAEEVTKKGRFCFPFFVRYAYRLYDQTITMHSSPVLMLASSPDVSAIWKVGRSKDYYNKSHTLVEGYKLETCASSLDWCVVDQSVIPSIEEWSDIIKSVDIFISAPIYNYDQEGNLAYTSLKEPPSGRQYFIGRTQDETEYTRRFLNDSLTVFELSRPAEKVRKDISNCSSFYLLRSVDIKDIPTTRTVIDIEEDYLQSIEAKEVMTDDFGSHDHLTARTAFPYNGRVSVGDITKNLFRGFSPAGVFSHATSGGRGMEYTRILVRIRNNEGDIVVESDSKEMVLLGDYFFYPNPDASEAMILTASSEGGPYTMSYRFRLSPHDHLNGAYYYGTMAQLPYGVYTIPDVTPAVVNLPNRIYTSLVDNPFTFPAELATFTGAGTILTMAVAKQAMSPSQFGQFPLYAFTSEGVWAMTITSEGALNPAQPITGDVCVNPKGIASLDSSVLFATERGVMLLAGSQTQCISDTINAGDLFSIDDLPKSDALFSLYTGTASETETADDRKLMPFLEFLKDSSFLYDYVHQHVLMFNPGVSYAYVYSLKSRLWGMTGMPLVRECVRSGGTGAYISLPYTERTESQSINGIALYDFSKSDGEDVTALVITRPFKLGQPFEFKTVDTIIQRGAMARDAVRQVLYGTNDFRHWFTVWSSGDIYMRGFRGTPYKAYRLAMVARLGSEDNLHGCTVQFNMRLMNQPR